MLSILALSLLAQSAANPAPASTTNLHVRIASRWPRAVLEDRLAAYGFDTLHSHAADPVSRNGVELVVSRSERDELVARGLDVTVVAEGRPLTDILAASSNDVPGGYRDLAAVLLEMNDLAAQYPSLAQVVDLTATYGTPPTAEGRHLFALKISDSVALDEDEPAVLVVSAHHCREIVTPVIALDAADRLLSGYAANTQIRAAVDAHEIWIAPVWNPDGYHHVFTADNLWRKNRRVFPNGIGVDLNRNYAFGWSNGCSGSSSVNSSTYKGPAPASEAETQTMEAFSNDRRFAKVLDFHSSGRETLWGYDCNASPIDTFWRSEATQLSTAAGYGGAERPPSADGEHYQWQYGAFGAMSFLTETHTQFQPSYASAQAEAATVWPGILWMLARDVPVSGRVTDACSGLPLDATIALSNATQGEVSRSGGPLGRYYAYLPPGTHTLRFEAPGYVAANVQVTVGASGTATEDVQLVPAASASTTFCTATPNSTGLVPTIYFVGSASLATNQFALFVERLPTMQPAAFSASQAVATPAALYDGFLCLRRPSLRLGPSPTDFLGRASRAVDLSLPLAPGHSILPGSTWGFQLVYRDPASSGVGLNLSPGLEVTFCP